MRIKAGEWLKMSREERLKILQRVVRANLMKSRQKGWPYGSAEEDFALWEVRSVVHRDPN